MTLYSDEKGLLQADDLPTSPLPPYSSDFEPSLKQRRPVWQYILGATLLLVSIPVLYSAAQSSAPQHASSSTKNSLLLPDVERLTDGKEQALEGGLWAQELHAAIQPVCKQRKEAVFYEKGPRTIFASSPRSGNSYTSMFLRSLLESWLMTSLGSLLEKATGYATGAIYCDDPSLAKTFIGECSQSQ